MIQVDIPGRQVYRLDYLVLDLNGTISLDGNLIDGVADRLQALRSRLDISIVTADTLGQAQETGKALNVRIHKLNRGQEQAQKADYVRQLGAENTVSIGNGANDVLMLQESALGICVLGPEGASAEAVTSCDVVVTDINRALDLLLKPERLIATLRK